MNSLLKLPNTDAAMLARLNTTAKRIFGNRREAFALRSSVPMSALRTVMTRVGQPDDGLYDRMQGTAQCNNDDITRATKRIHHLDDTFGNTPWRQLPVQKRNEFVASAQGEVRTDMMVAADAEWSQMCSKIMVEELTKVKDIMTRTQGGSNAHYNDQLQRQKEDPDVKAELADAKAEFDENARQEQAARRQAEVAAAMAALDRNNEARDAHANYDAEFGEIDLREVEAAEQEAAAPEEAAAVQTEHAAAERAVSPPSTPPAGAVAAPVASETPRKRRRAPAPTTGVKKPKPNPNTTTGARKRKTTTRK